MKFLFVYAILILETNQQVQIKCYDCITPTTTSDLTTYCNSSLYCKGVFCTKGPDATSNGILHGCSNTPPLEKSITTCKWASNSLGKNTNCYCKNIDFCNDSPSWQFLFIFKFTVISIAMNYLL